MKPYWSQVRLTLETLAYVVTGFDQDGMELIFSNSTKTVRHKNRGNMLDRFDTITPIGQRGIALSLQRIQDNCNADTHPLSRWLHRARKKGFSIYILTDGVWEDGHDASSRLFKVINHAITKLTTTVDIGIKFIQFGNDAVGTDRLRRLDHGWKEYGIERYAAISLILIKTQPDQCAQGYY
jgi:hypothetical protein